LSHLKRLGPTLDMSVHMHFVTRRAATVCGI